MVDEGEVNRQRSKLESGEYRGEKELVEKVCGIE